MPKTKEDIKCVNVNGVCLDHRAVLQQLTTLKECQDKVLKKLTFMNRMLIGNLCTVIIFLLIKR